MEIETIGKYQLHLIAYEMAPQKWDPYLSVMRFDDAKEDFVCVLEKLAVAGAPYPDYQKAVEAARLVGNQLVQSGQL